MFTDLDDIRSDCSRRLIRAAFFDGDTYEELAQRVPAVALEVLRGAGTVMAWRMRANLTQQLPSA